MANETPTLNAGADLRDIAFADFTANLVLKVFDGLVAANLSQTEAYLQLVQEVGKSLSEYVNSTKDDIDGAQILQFLVTVLPKDTTTGEPKLLQEGTTLTSDETGKLNKALLLPSTDGGAPNDNQVAPAGALKKDDLDKILDAAARRLAANKYDLLKEMVKQGLLRLVINHGIIQTSLSYSATRNSFYQSNKSSYDSKNFTFNANASTGSALARWVKASASTSYTSVSVRTANETQQDFSGTSVNVFGFVRIEFKTDYLPLA